MFKKSIVLLDTDALCPELFFPLLDSLNVTYVFIWDEALFERRFFSQKRKRFIYDALQNIEDLMFIEGDSNQVLTWIRQNHPEAHIFYASRFQDRFTCKLLERLSIADDTFKVQPLPKTFFPFFKKISQKGLFA